MPVTFVHPQRFFFHFKGSMVRSESLQSGLVKRDSKSGTVNQSKRGSLTSIKSGSGQDVKLATATPTSTPDRASVYRLSAGSKSSQNKDLSEISVT